MPEVEPVTTAGDLEAPREHGRVGTAAPHALAERRVVEPAASRLPYQGEDLLCARRLVRGKPGAERIHAAQFRQNQACLRAASAALQASDRSRAANSGRL